jgi:hypothetical protein
MLVRRLVPALALMVACGALAAPGAFAKPPRGYTLIDTTDIVAPAGQQAVGDVTCPSGLVPLSGSVSIHSSSLQADVFDSTPLPHGWEAFVNNASAAPVTFDVEVVCAKQPKSYSIVFAPFTQNPSGEQDASVVNCPAGSKPLGGGVSASSDELGVSVSSMSLAGHTWRAVENNVSPGSDAIAAFVVCGKIAGYTVVQGAAVLDPPGSHTESFATCPAPTVPIGGGTSTSSTILAVSLAGMGVSGSNFVSFINNAVDVSGSSTTAICAGR